MPVTKAEQACQAGRASAGADYASCALRALTLIDFQKLTVLDAPQQLPGYRKAMGRCRRRYAAAWPKLQAKAKGTGSTCDNLRFVDNGDGTVTDHLTALQWEKKDDLDGRPNFDDPHDADNYYTWSGINENAPADGTVFTDFIHALDTPGECFVGHCDWHIPSRDELATIGVVGVSDTCYSTPLNGNPPCIEPVFGPTVPSRYCTDTTFPTLAGYDSWFVDFARFDRCCGRQGWRFLRLCARGARGPLIL